MEQEPKKGTRRRGRALEDAIFSATLDELVRVGYTALALDHVARRAQTGRATLYRRWSNKRDLVADAVASALPPLERAPDTGHLRTDLLICFEQMHGLLDGVGRLALQALAAELHDPTDNVLTDLIREQVLEPRLQVVLDVLLRAASRHEIEATAAVPVLARTGPALLFQHALMFGKPPPRTHIEELIDRVILPAAGMARQS
ncbi:TetR/AcrR family transcriptional regulator [Streptomyces sp. Tue6028]|uniref:TetR/AcrR family transcriptional regulator n=1 Tax=Streptomyces sp. Tue6028 TaxID=2036037 RepID=UPI003D7361D5